MSKTSIINHPKKDEFVIIRNWQKQYCAPLGKTADCAAALMAKFENWHNANTEAVERGERKATTIVCSFQYIRTKLNCLWSVNTIRKAIDFLDAQEVIKCVGGGNSKNQYDLQFVKINFLSDLYSRGETFSYIKVDKQIKGIKPRIKVDKRDVKVDKPRIKVDKRDVKVDIHKIDIKEDSNKDINIESSLNKNSDGVECDSVKFIEPKKKKVKAKTKKGNEPKVAAKGNLKKGKKKAEKKPPAWSKLWATDFDLAFKEINGVNYTLQGKDFADLKRSYLMMAKLFKKRNPDSESDDETLRSGWQWLLGKASKMSWLRSNFSPSNIANQFNGIVVYKTQKEKTEIESIDYYKQKYGNQK